MCVRTPAWGYWNWLGAAGPKDCNLHGHYLLHCNLQHWYLTVWIPLCYISNYLLHCLLHCDCSIDTWPLNEIKEFSSCRILQWYTKCLFKWCSVNYSPDDYSFLGTKSSTDQFGLCTSLITDAAFRLCALQGSGAMIFVSQQNRLSVRNKRAVHWALDTAMSCHHTVCSSRWKFRIVESCARCGCCSARMCREMGNLPNWSVSESDCVRNAALLLIPCRVTGTGIRVTGVIDSIVAMQIQLFQPFDILLTFEILLEHKI